MQGGVRAYERGSHSLKKKGLTSKRKCVPQTEALYDSARMNLSREGESRSLQGASKDGGPSRREIFHIQEILQGKKRNIKGGR